MARMKPAIKPSSDLTALKSRFRDAQAKKEMLWKQVVEANREADDSRARFQAAKEQLAELRSGSYDLDAINELRHKIVPLEAEAREEEEKRLEVLALAQKASLELEKASGQLRAKATRELSTELHKQEAKILSTIDAAIADLMICKAGFAEYRCGGATEHELGPLFRNPDRQRDAVRAYSSLLDEIIEAAG